MDVSSVSGASPAELLNDRRFRYAVLGAAAVAAIAGGWFGRSLKGAIKGVGVALVGGLLALVSPSLIAYFLPKESSRPKKPGAQTTAEAGAQAGGAERVHTGTVTVLPPGTVKAGKVVGEHKYTVEGPDGPETKHVDILAPSSEGIVTGDDPRVKSARVFGQAAESGRLLIRDLLWFFQRYPEFVPIIAVAGELALRAVRGDRGRPRKALPGAHRHA